MPQYVKYNDVLSAFQFLRGPYSIISLSLPLSVLVLPSFFVKPEVCQNIYIDIFKPAPCFHLTITVSFLSALIFSESQGRQPWVDLQDLIS